MSEVANIVVSGKKKTGWTALLLAGMLLVPVYFAHAGGGVIYVDHSATGDNDGGSWANAFTDLQAALTAAGAGDEIWVAAGVYKPVVPSDPDDVTEAEREATFNLVSGVGLYGGFVGNESDRDQRDWLTHITVLSGDIDDNDSVDDRGVVLDANDIQGRNSYTVVTGIGVDTATVIDGFLITAGGNDQAFGFGGGMRNGNGDPTVSNIHFIGNRADSGGGMYTEVSSPTLINLRFSGNRASYMGGGLYVNASDATLINASFIGNVAQRNGGGMVNQASDTILTNLSFSGNSTLGDFDESGGAIFNLSGGNPVIRNTIIWQNRDSTGTGSPTASIGNFSANPQISFSLIQGCNPDGAWNANCGSDAGDNLADANPLFIDTPNPTGDAPITGNLRLQEGSPAINAGNNDFVVDVSTDLDGGPRILPEGGTVDLGPYELLSEILFRDRFE